MGDAPSHQDAVAQLEAQIVARWPTAEPLDQITMSRRFGPNASRAWLLPAALEEAPHDVIAVVDDAFPWSLPQIHLKDPPRAITVPHVEANGHLCLHRADVAYDVPVDISHLGELLQHADDLLREGRTGTNTDDFLDEAQSYWTIVQPSSSQILLVSAHSDSAAWHSTRVGNDFVVAATVERLRKWCDGLGREMSYVEPALLVKLPGPTLPSAYPLTLSDLFKIVDTAGATPLLNLCLASWRQQGPVPVVLSFEHAGRPILLGAAIPRPANLQMAGTRKKGLPGFRPNAGSPTSKRWALAQYPGRFDHLRVLPVSRDDLLLRSAGSVSSAARDARVAILGCGALGAPLAILMLQAGVGRLELVDDDTLDWRNIGRHVLDGHSIGKNKAAALARAALLRFPDAEVNAHEMKWQRLYGGKDRVLEGCDLVISCTAHPASNLHMDQLISNGDLPGAVFAWVEPFAFASHAVWRSTNGESLSTILNRDGTMRTPVVDLESAPSLAVEPACGAIYQPFTSLSAMHGVALTAELALDALESRVSGSLLRTWVGTADALHSAGLSITAEWARRLSDLGYARRYETPLLPS